MHRVAVGKTMKRKPWSFGEDLETSGLGAHS